MKPAVFLLLELPLFLRSIRQSLKSLFYRSAGSIGFWLALAPLLNLDRQDAVERILFFSRFGESPGQNRDKCRVDFDGNRALQQRYGYHQSMIALNAAK